MRPCSRVILFALLLLATLTGCGTGVTKPATPVFTPNGGNFTAVTKILAQSPGNEGVVRYTVDGTTPTAQSPAMGGGFFLSSTTTVRAIVIGNFGVNSDVASATFTIDLPQLPAPAITPATGTYVGPQTITLASPAGATLFYTTDGTPPTASSTRYTGRFTVGNTTTVRAFAVLSGYLDSPVATSTVTIIAPTVATPGINPAGGAFAAAQTVTLSDSTSGAAIFYTTDGTTPTAASTRYTSALRIASSATVRAFATATGYQNSPVATATFTITAGTSLSANVTLGGKPVSGATAQIFAAGMTGAGSTPTVRSTGTVTTDAAGNASLAYTCGSATDQIYLASRNGTPAGRAGGAVSNLVLLAALGNCGSLGTSYHVNEVTTIAASYALAAFTDPTATSASPKIGATATNATGIANAFLNANVIANPVTGTIGGAALASSSTLPSAEIASLASIIGSCGGSSGCAPLLVASTPIGKASPNDSFEAIVTIASHPGNNVATLFALAKAGSGLAAAPLDWTLAIRHTGGGIAKPTALGIDRSGSVWAASYAGALVKLSPEGAAISPTTGYIGGGMKELLGLTIDTAGNIWVASSESANGINSGLGAVQKFSGAGLLLSGTNGYGGSAVYFPEALAADANGNIWVANYGNSTVAELNGAGTALSANGGLGAGTAKFAFPIAVATDGANGAWFTNQGGSTITHAAADRTLGTPVTCCNAPSGVALGISGDVWATNYYGNSLSEIASNGTVVSAGYTGGGIVEPQGIAVDGAGTVWVANYHANTLSAFLGETASNPGTAISGSSGFGTSAGLSLTTRIAIDGSGNLWAASNGNDAIIEFIGIATPVKTPLIGLPVQP